MIIDFKEVIGIDPSGNFSAGKGGNGLFLISPNKAIEDTVWAKDYETKRDFFRGVWASLKSMLEQCENPLVVIEDFRLQFGKASAQSNQKMETSELIGALETKLDELNIKYKRQQNTVKSRWKDKLMLEELEDLGHTDFKFSSRHAKDAARHALNGWFFTKDKDLW